MRLAGIVLVVLGLLVLVYQGFSYKTREKVLDVGPIEVNKESTKSVPLPPIIGGVALIAGVVLVVKGGK